jgi:Tol biopolymer transport system component
MPDPGGKGIYYVNGKSSGFLSAYHVKSKESTDIVSEDATQPAISPDGKRVMYITFPTPQRNEIWVSDIDGGNKVKIATAEELDTGGWAPDNFHLLFFETGASNEPKAYIAGADGSGLRQVPPAGDAPIYTGIWGPDQKSVYVSTKERGEQLFDIWKWSLDGSTSEKFVEKCSQATNVDPGGKYLVGMIGFGEKAGIYEMSISERKCVSLLPGVVTHGATFARDGKSFLYAVASRGEVSIYRQLWSDGKTIGKPQVAVKVPFPFPIFYFSGNAYDFSSDLSTIVYARPGGHADLYLLSQK